MKKKSSWGKKAPPRKEINLDDPIDVPIYTPVKIADRKFQSNKAKSFSEKAFSQKQEIINRLNDSRKKINKAKGDKRGVLIIKDYMRFLHNEYGVGHGTPMEVHHWMPKGRIQQNDFFVCCLSPKDHFEIHHGHSSVNEFIEQRRMDNLLMDSATLFASWLTSKSGQGHRYSKHFIGMIKDIYINPTDFDYVLKITRECAEEIRVNKK